MEFTLHGFDVYTSEVDDKGIDFVVCDDPRRHYYDVQVKSVRNLNYIFFRKEYFVPRKNLLAAIVLLPELEPPELYLVPSHVWLQPNQLFVSRDYGPPKKSKPEWGLNLSGKNHPLLTAFSFDQTVKSLCEKLLTELTRISSVVLGNPSGAESSACEEPTGYR